jgi:hypothetical protein
LGLHIFRRGLPILPSLVDTDRKITRNFSITQRFSYTDTLTNTERIGFPGGSKYSQSVATIFKQPVAVTNQSLIINA